MSRLMAYSPLFQLQNQMNRLFEDFFEDMPAQRPYAAAYPGLNIWEDADTAYVEAELPGMTMNDIEVYVNGNELTIAGERKIAEQKDATWHRRERAAGRFSRSLTMPWEVDANKVEARLRDGVLTVALPKSESAKPKKVKVLGA